jgi:hypothetical protein
LRRGIGLGGLLLRGGGSILGGLHGPVARREIGAHVVEFALQGADLLLDGLHLRVAWSGGLGVGGMPGQQAAERRGAKKRCAMVKTITHEILASRRFTDAPGPRAEEWKSSASLR